MRVPYAAIGLISMLLCGPTLYADETSIEGPREAKELQKEIKERREEIQEQKKEAEILENNEAMVLLRDLDQFLEAQSFCVDKEEDIEMDVCIVTTVKKLAVQGNFIAQHQLGNIYENAYSNRPMAKEWYQKALDNPETPKHYKLEVMKDLKRLEENKIKPQSNDD